LDALLDALGDAVGDRSVELAVGPSTVVGDVVGVGVPPVLVAVGVGVGGAVGDTVGVGLAEAGDGGSAVVVGAPPATSDGGMRPQPITTKTLIAAATARSCLASSMSRGYARGRTIARISSFVERS
jgi:hypothetical protein